MPNSAAIFLADPSSVGHRHQLDAGLRLEASEW